MIEIEKMVLEKKENCVGCWACFNRCPKQALNMVEDDEGFRYPCVEQDKCVQCGACARVCPILNPLNAIQTEGIPDTYAAINENWEVRQDSSSGGVFQLLAEYVLHKKGIVFGAGFDENWEVVHRSVTDIDELKTLRVSKYLQSRIEDTYKKVQQELQAGRLVLFSGTPCQCVALKKYIKRDYENLILVDFICHGVPSPAIWRTYVSCRVGKNTIQNISFRNKNLSWERYLLVFFFTNTNKYLGADLNTDIYLRGFLQNLYLRPACHECKFCKKNRPVDITMADFWGVQEEIPEMYDGKGTSLVVIHSDKGRKIFRQISAKKAKVDYDKAVGHNPSMLHPSEPSKHREMFFYYFKQNNVDICNLIQKYTQPSMKTKIKNKLKIIPGLYWSVKFIKRYL